MSKFLANTPAVFITTLAGALTLIGTATVINSLEQATARQCASHDWPADKHQVHVEWCMDNGYQVKYGPGY